MAANSPGVRLDWTEKSVFSQLGGTDGDHQGVALGRIWPSLVLPSQGELMTQLGEEGGGARVPAKGMGVLSSAKIPQVPSHWAVTSHQSREGQIKWLGACIWQEIRWRGATGMAFILAWPLLLGLKVTHRPKGQSMVPRWEKNMFVWLGNNGPLEGVG